MSNATKEQSRRAAIALVAAVLILPLAAIGVILSLGLFEGSIAVEVRNVSQADLRDVRLEIDGSRRELGALAAAARRHLDARLPARTELRVEHRLAGEAIWRRGPLFKLDAGMQDRAFQLVFTEGKVWELKSSGDL